MPLLMGTMGGACGGGGADAAESSGASETEEQWWETEKIKSTCPGNSVHRM